MVIQLLQKLATAATHALPKRLMSKDIYILKDGGRSLSVCIHTVLFLPQ